MEHITQQTRTHSHNTTEDVTDHKPGRTLLVKSTGNIDTKVFESLEGLQNTFYTEKSNSYFLTFATAEQSATSMKKLHRQLGSSARLKYAHYRVYFTISGLTNESDYNTIKLTHTGVVTKTSGCNVLYYRLYRKNDTYLGCGDMTLDTKEGFDHLMNSESLKNFTLGDITGTHFRYNKTSSDNSTRPRTNTRHSARPPRQFNESI